MNGVVGSLARFLLSCWLICQGANLVGNPERYIGDYRKLLDVVDFGGFIDAGSIEWYGHLLFVLGVTFLAKFAVSRYLAILLLLIENFLTVLALSRMDSYYHHSMVQFAAKLDCEEHLPAGSDGLNQEVLMGCYAKCDCNYQILFSELRTVLS